MVEQYNDNLDSIFHALADPTRREIVRLIASKECTVSERAVPLICHLVRADIFHKDNKYFAIPIYVR